MEFLQIAAAYFRSESKHNYKVKYCFRALPLEKTVLLEDRTATEFSYQSYAACY
jgi:hypothetical protein